MSIVAVRRRARLERATYVAAAAGVATAPNLGSSVLDAVAVAVGAGLTWWGAKRVEVNADGLASAGRLAPALTGSGAYVVNMLTDSGWIEVAVAGGWGALWWLACPLTRLSGLASMIEESDEGPQVRPQLYVVPHPEPESEEQAGSGDRFVDTVTRMWLRANVGDTTLHSVHRHQDGGRDFSAMVKAPAGKAVPALSEVQVAAAFGVVAEAVRICETDRGPGWAEIEVTPDAHAARRAKGPTDAEWWEKKVARARGAAPGSVLEGRRRDAAKGVTHWVAAMADDSETPKVDERKAATALGLSHDDGRVFVATQGHRFMISVYDAPPLAEVVPANRELLTPDERGFFVAGRSYDGRHVKSRVHRPEGIAMNAVLGVSGSGKTQLIGMLVAADANAGMASWLAAASADEKTSKLGEHVECQGFSPLYMVRMLRAAVALMDIRAQMKWADGQCRDWKPGVPGCPYPPLKIYADEYLAACQDQRYGDEIQELMEHLSVKGRKYGIGPAPAGQSGLVDNGFTSTLKNQLKANGRTIVLNMGSADATRRAFDGLCDNEHIPGPLPAEYGGTRLTLEELQDGVEDPEDSVGSGGVGWIVVKGRPTLMRTLYVDFDYLEDLFPDTVTRISAHEVEELTKLGLWGDWYEPEPEPEKKQRGSTEPFAGDPDEALALLGV